MADLTIHIGEMEERYLVRTSGILSDIVEGIERVGANTDLSTSTASQFLRLLQRINYYLVEIEAKLETFNQLTQVYWFRCFPTYCFSSDNPTCPMIRRFFLH